MNPPHSTQEETRDAVLVALQRLPGGLLPAIDGVAAPIRKFVQPRIGGSAHDRQRRGRARRPLVKK